MSIADEPVYELLQLITEKIYCGILAVDAAGKVLVLNPSAQRVLNLSPETVIGKSLAAVSRRLAELFRSTKGQGRHKLTVGKANLVVNLSPLIKAEKTIGVLAVFHESGKEECISQELFVTENLLKEINIFLESSYDGIFITDNQGKVIRVNAAWERIFAPRHLVLGRTVEELVTQGVYGKSAAGEVLKSGKTSTVIMENKGRKILATGTPVFNNRGKITSAVVNVRDITELENLRWQLEQQQKISEQYSREIQEMRRQQQKFPGIVANSKEFQKVMDMVTRVAEVDSTVLITGESGVGKEVVAGHIHKLSHRRNGPFIKINCGAIPLALLESELFGYEPGAFTGASPKGKLGLFELANKGTLLLDEIAETSLDIQVKLLRALQEKEIIRVGGQTTKKIDVRIIAATNRNLKTMLQAGKFRDDLYYRLNVINIQVPPLRERPDDILPLLVFFLEKYNQKYQKNKAFSPKVVAALTNYDWPGNIRELENLAENLVILAKGEEIMPYDLPETYCQPAAMEHQVMINGIMPLKQALATVEQQLLQNAREKYDSTRKIAEALGINQSTVVRKLRSLPHQ
ncbi:MAG: sigma 54-interacting transcriptional regulator [Heliobacteriaceae bacterium]|nr:sigma 54-interacting transcriptional regulator [Heliobacteriaceae bacterium]